jgi:hypothetical protein
MMHVTMKIANTQMKKMSTGRCESGRFADFVFSVVAAGAFDGDAAVELTRQL